METFLKTVWEARYDDKRAATCSAQLVPWYNGDISANPLYGGDLARALAAIKARVMLLPGETDLYFRVADNAAELRHLAHGELKPIPSIWGHRAGRSPPMPRSSRRRYAVGSAEAADRWNYAVRRKRQ